MTSKDDVDAQSNGSGLKTVDEVVDVKQEKDTGSTRIVTANGNTQDVESAGDFMAKLNTGNIIIDPTLVEKAVKNNMGPPLTIAEALERGDFQALARLMQAQIARAENGDLEGMRHEDAQKYAFRLKEKEAMEERVREREREVLAHFDPQGGYRDRRGGYYDVNEGAYIDADGGVVDNYGGYRYKNGNYKSKFGDFYDAKTNTVHLTTGEVITPPKGMSGDEVIREMQQSVREQGGYDPNYIKNGAMAAADAEHPSTDPKAPKVGAVGVPLPSEVAERAKANEGADTNRPNPGSASSLKDRLARRGATVSAPAPASENTPAPPAVVATGANPSRFSNGSSTAETPRGADGEVTSSSFFAVDSSISASKFPGPKKDAVDTEAPDPVVTSNTTTPQRPAVKSPVP
ncbi:MAG: hypothetical protein ACAH83_00970 [Alphaproteobacteria bacterium]